MVCSVVNEWKPLKSIEGLDGLDTVSLRFMEYMKLTQGISGSPYSKVGKDIERLGLKSGVLLPLILLQCRLLIRN